MDGTGATLGDTTPVFGPNQPEMVPQHPKHGGGWINVHLLLFSIDVQIETCHNNEVWFYYSRIYSLHHVTKNKG
jgi:hypothetical protein